MLAKCALLSFALSFCATAESIDYAEAESHVGETLTVTGKVNRVNTIASGMTFVTFGGGGSEFTVVFRAHLLDGKTLEGFEGREVEVTGTIELYKDKPQILARSLDDLRLASGAEIPKTPAGKMDPPTKATTTFEIREINLTEEETEAAGTAPSGSKVKSIKLAINTPARFDPKTPQRVLIVFPDYMSGDDIKRPLSDYNDTAAAAGWLAITPLGPVLERDLSAEWNITIVLAALTHLEKDFPDLKSWPLYLAGNGDGATSAMLVSGGLVDQDYKVSGCFLGSLWKPRFEDSIATFRPPTRIMRRIPVFLSQPKEETERNEKNAETIEDQGFKEVRIDTHEGDKYINPESLSKALKWFGEMAEE